MLAVDPGQTLSLVGGDVQIDGGVLIAPGGLVQIGSVASPGNALLNAQDMNLGSFAASDRSAFGRGNYRRHRFAPTASASRGGTVAIRSGRLIVDNGAVITTNTFDVAGAPVGIDLGATESIVLRNGAAIRTESFGAGDASGISIATGNLAVTDLSAIESWHSPPVAPGTSIFRLAVPTSSTERSGRVRAPAAATSPSTPPIP